MESTDQVFSGCTASEICHQAAVLAAILRIGETFSQSSLATCLFHLEGLLHESTPISQSVLAYELAERIAPAFGVPFPVVSEFSINAAVAAERERCAKIAEDNDDCRAADACGVACNAGSLIAESIRNGVPKRPAGKE